MRGRFTGSKPIGGRWFAAFLAAVLCANTGAQQGTPPEGKPLDLLEHALDSLDGKPATHEAVSNEELQRQLDDLREVVGDLQRVIDEKLVAIQQLEDENESLRQALRLRFGSGGGGLPPVPIPNRELIESVLKESPPVAERKEVIGPASSPEAFTVISEWGRSPEVASSLPGEVSSLIGMTIAVEPGTNPESLYQLGEELRENYAHYDNINIEVFDDVAAARRFAEKGEVDEKRRVMSVSRFKHSGRDNILVFRNGRPVPRQ